MRRIYGKYSLQDLDVVKIALVARNEEWCTSLVLGLGKAQREDEIRSLCSSKAVQFMRASWRLFPINGVQICFCGSKFSWTDWEVSRLVLFVVDKHGCTRNAGHICYRSGTRYTDWFHQLQTEGYPPQEPLSHWNKSSGAVLESLIGS